MPSKGALTLLNLVTVIAVAVAAFYFGEQSALRKLGNKKDDEKKDKEETKTDPNVEFHSNNETQSDTDIVEESKGEKISTEENSEDDVELHSSSSSCSFEMVEKDGNKKLKQENREDAEMADESSYQIQPIGYIRSIYRLCVGTPRQGLLAPNSRGRIDFISKNVSPDSILELEHFSHLWILFQFHLNTKGKDSKDNNNNNNNKSKKLNQQYSSKIAPPALGGKKVGIFATRTPHRPNAIGFTLCKLESIALPQKQKKKLSDKNDSTFSINISGIDLVDGTPVFDIKPFVPHYDSVGYDDKEQSSSNAASLPTWVSSGLGKRREVVILPHARNQLEIIMKHESDNGMKFYGVKTGRDKSEQDALQHIIECILEVLSVDVRSAWQTKKARKGKFQAERANRIKQVITESQSSTDDKTSVTSDVTDDDINLCTQQIDNLLIKYSVKSAPTDVPQCELPSAESPINTDGSGADDQVIVQAIELITQGNNVIEIPSIQNENTVKEEEELEISENNAIEKELDDDAYIAATNEPNKLVLEEPANIEKEELKDNNMNTAPSESKGKKVEDAAKNGTEDINDNANNTVTDVEEGVKTSVTEKFDSPCVDDPKKANVDTAGIETETIEKHNYQVDLQTHIHEICEQNEKIRSSKDSITSKTEHLGDNNNANNTEEGTRSSTSSFSNGSFVVVDNFTMPVSEISIVDSSAEHNKKNEGGKDDNAVNDDKFKTSFNNQSQEHELEESSQSAVEKKAQSDKKDPNKSISKGNPTMSGQKKEIVEKLPDDGHTSFGTLKSFWSKRGSNYTPNGLVPEKSTSKETKFFVYSDKPIPVPKKKATKSPKISSTGSVEQPILMENSSPNDHSEHQSADDSKEPNKLENEANTTCAEDNETDKVSSKIEE